MSEEIKITEDSIEKEVKELKESLDNKLTEIQVAELIKNNMFIVNFEGNTYRLDKPSTQQVSEMYEKVANKKIEFLMQDNVLPAEILKKKWKEKGIDIFEMEKKIEALQKEKEKYEYTLGKVLEEDKETDNPESFKNKIDDIKSQQRALNNQIMQYLDISLENRLGTFQYMYLTYLITRKKVDDNGKENWVKAFDTYDNYLSMSPLLTNRLNVYTVLLVKDELQSI
jgi:hypothetical protein